MKESGIIGRSWTQEGILSSYQKLVSEPYPATSLVSSLSNQVMILGRERQVKRIAILMLFNVTCFLLLLAWCSSTRSMALQAYTYTVGFNLLSLLTCILTIWVERNGPTPLFSFGYERFEVLAIFASTVLAQLGSLFIIKESIERLVLEQPEIHTGRLLLGTGIAFVSHIIIIYGCNNVAFDHVIAASSSSWLQEHVSDISQSICSVVPILSGLLLPRINPMLLVACAGGISLFITNLLIQFRSCYVVDTLVAIAIATITFATMLPMSIYSGKVLLQTTPSHIVGQLDKCLRETLTIDGVLEFRNEHFWTLSFGKMAGSLQVRVRRDADEQLVLAHVVDRLSNLVSVLTVQVFKDDWTMRKASSVPHASTQHLTPFNNTPSLSPNIPFTNSTLLPLSNANSSNGNIFPHHSMTPVTQTKLHSFPNNSLMVIPNSGVSVQTSSAVANTVPNSSSIPRNYWRQPMVDSHHIPAQNKNVFFPEFSTPNIQQQKQIYANNLLISGTRTLDENQFTHHPR
ncbi:hypothetical protein L9F63_005734 [Diploptera punctata]|uniref:Cation efflux protein transmembrane domain-containing protein n=1 Tax=Diploptera punctata TaxID=6984 RepID=A0AAD7ZBK3_DIPPU|nr:hypothetical protein L9F63_005734 [Diploptera punctata]